MWNILIGKVKLGTSTSIDSDKVEPNQNMACKDVKDAIVIRSALQSTATEGDNLAFVGFHLTNPLFVPVVRTKMVSDISEIDVPN
jgi:hypothetical protein